VRHLDENRLRNILQRLYRPDTQFDISNWLQERRKSKSELGDFQELRG